MFYLISHCTSSNRDHATGSTPIHKHLLRWMQDFVAVMATRPGYSFLGPIGTMSGIAQFFTNRRPAKEESPDKGARKGGEEQALVVEVPSDEEEEDPAKSLRKKPKR